MQKNGFKLKQHERIGQILKTQLGTYQSLLQEARQDYDSNSEVIQALVNAQKAIIDLTAALNKQLANEYGFLPEEIIKPVYHGRRNGL